MTHLAVFPIKHFPTHRLAEYEVTTTALTAAAKSSVASADPRTELLRNLCTFYCFQPKVTPEDIIDFKILNSSDERRMLVQLFLKPQLQ